MQLIVRANFAPNNAELIYRVMDAAISVNPDWVIENSRRRAEKIMDNKKAEYYSYAVDWLKKARLAYMASGRQAEWKKYYQHLLGIHCRKRKLMELQPFRLLLYLITAGKAVSFNWVYR